MIEKRTITGTIEYRAEGDAMPKELGGIAAVVNNQGRLITRLEKITTFAAYSIMRAN